MLLGGFITVVSGCHCTLSFHFVGEPLLGALEAKADRVRCRLEDCCNLARLEFLPRPQLEYFPVGLVEMLERRLDVSELDAVGGIARIGGRWLRREPVDESEPSACRPAPVGECPLCDAVAPWQDGIGRDVVDPTPDREKCIAERLLGVVDGRAPTQVPLQGLVHLFCDGFEADPPLDVRAHTSLLSARPAILSGTRSWITTGHQRGPDSAVMIYAARALLDRMGRPITADAVREAPFIGFVQGESLVDDLKAHGVMVSPDNFRWLTNSFLASLEMVRQGLGMGVMLNEVATRMPELECVLPEMKPIAAPMWLVAHRELHSSKRIGLVFDLLVEAFAGEL